METPVQPRRRPIAVRRHHLRAPRSRAVVVSRSSRSRRRFYSNWYAIFKTVHVLFAVLWVGGGVLLTLFAISRERSTTRPRSSAVARQAAFVGEKVFAPAGLVVFLMGVAMMINTDWGWGTFWIDAGLVGYASTFITGIAVLSPLGKKIQHVRRGEGSRRTRRRWR